MPASWFIGAHSIPAECCPGPAACCLSGTCLSTQTRHLIGRTWLSVNTLTRQQNKLLVTRVAITKIQTTCERRNLSMTRRTKPQRCICYLFIRMLLYIFHSPTFDPQPYIQTVINTVWLELEGIVWLQIEPRADFSVRGDIWSRSSSGNSQEDLAWGTCCISKYCLCYNMQAFLLFALKGFFFFSPLAPGSFSARTRVVPL